MKSLSAALIFGLFVSGLCFAQTQTGNASYNASKEGLTIAHPSMSFGTRVRITNLRNNQEVIATVDGRIPSAEPRIADISAEAGNAIGMPSRGYTEVRLEQLVPVHAAEEKPAAIPPPVEPALYQPPRSGVPPQQPPAPPDPAPVSGQEAARPEAVPPVAPPYLAGQNCLPPALGLAILFVLIIIALLLTAILILILMMRRLPWNPWFYPLWVRRHIRYIKKRR
jgi:hypothetical protein